MRNILAVDPSLRCSGWAVVGLDSGLVVACGTVETVNRANKAPARPKKAKVVNGAKSPVKHKRKRGQFRKWADKHAKARFATEDVHQIASDLVALARKYRVAGLAAELPASGGKSGDGVVAIAYSLAIQAAIAACLDLPIWWPTYEDVKLLAGSKDAEKSEVAKVVYTRWPELLKLGKSNSGYHITDALGVYLAAEKKIQTHFEGAD